MEFIRSLVGGGRTQGEKERNNENVVEWSVVELSVGPMRPLYNEGRHREQGGTTHLRMHKQYTGESREKWERKIEIVPKLCNEH